MQPTLLDLLQSSGPIPLDELCMRSIHNDQEVVEQLEALRKTGDIAITGPGATTPLSAVLSADPGLASQTIVEPSPKLLRRSFAR